MKPGITGFALAFLLGVSCLQFFTFLPGYHWFLLLLLLPALWHRSFLLQWLAVTALGFCWALFHAHLYHAAQLPEALAGEDIWVEGVVSDIPVRHERVLRFNFNVSQQEHHSARFKQLRLSWYDEQQPLRAGEHWRLLVRLKPPHGLLNPGGFDYERWLYQQGIHATGYVRNDTDNRKLAEASWLDVNRYRQLLMDQLWQQVTGRVFNDLMAALSVGYKSDISPEHWQVLTRTGTNHLMAISGLHIGLVAAMAFWLSRRLCPARLAARFSSLRVGAMMSLLAALVYAMLAGFAIPTQRALVMLAVVMLALLFKRQLRAHSGLSLALIAVLVFDPVSVLAPGFWFSFLAVAMIAYGFSGRLRRPVFWLQWGRLQWLLALGLLPVSLLLFNQASIVAPIANFILVPWVSFLVVPLVLLASMVLGIYAPLGQALFDLANLLLGLIWPIMEFLSGLTLSSWSKADTEPVFILLFFPGLLLLLAPRGLPLKWLGLFFIMPFMFDSSVEMKTGQYELTLLDVGQGLAVFIQTRDHQLLFDAGPGFGEHFNSGDRVILPFLKARGVDRLDRLVVSHADNDHMGGAQAVLDGIEVMELLGQGIERLIHPRRQGCQQGMSWQWDGVDFEFLHPDDVRYYPQRNNTSCVLKVSSDYGSVLLSSDIESRVEHRLLTAIPETLAADVLIVPHHGSKTSSSTAFISAVSPRLALVPAGYRNRFGHPRPDVMQRYVSNDIAVFNSAETGALTLIFNGSSSVPVPVSFRQTSGRYWNHW